MAGVGPSYIVVVDNEAMINAPRLCWWPEELRRAVYPTNTIEGRHRQVAKAIKTRGHFPDEQSATKLIYLAM